MFAILPGGVTGGVGEGVCVGVVTGTVERKLVKAVKVCKDNWFKT